MNAKKISKAAVVVLFLALIRTVAEPLRLQYYSTADLQFAQIKPFLIAGLFTSVSLLAITILNFYERYKTIIVIAVVDIIIMVIIKIIML